MKLQMKYNLLHITFWAAYCAIYGYVAVFLQSKGMSNSLIGVVTGVGAVSTIVISPMISGLVGKHGLTTKSLLLIMNLCMAVLFMAMAFLPLPTILIMIMFMILICLVVSCVPFLTTICMDHLRCGNYLDFGLSRGMGSVAYASTAFVLGQVLKYVSPNILAISYVLLGALFLVILFSIPDAKSASNTGKENKEESKSGNIIDVVKAYPNYFITLFGFGCCFAASSALAVYLINIVTSLGGSTELYGIAVFCMAASELPFMGLTHTLLKKFKAEQLLLFAACMYIVRNFLICLAPNIPILLIGMMMQGASYGLFTGVITYYVSDHLKEEYQIMGQTLIAMMTTGFGSTIGNVFGGVLQDAFSLQVMLYCAMAITVVGTVIAVLTQMKVLKSNK